MSHVQYIEEVLGKPFGKPPAMYENTLANRVWVSVSKVPLKKSWPISVTNLLRSSPNRNLGYYNAEAHSIFLSPNSNPDQLFQTESHETMHAYNQIHSNQLLTSDNYFRIITSKGIELLGLCEHAAISNFIDEGLAEYISETVMIKRMPKSALIGEYTKNREEVLEYLAKGVQINHTDLKQTGPVLSAQLWTRVFPPDTNFETMDFRIMVDRADKIINLKYELGYWCMAKYLNFQRENLGGKVDALLKDIPKSLRELEKRCFQ